MEYWRYHIKRGLNSYKTAMFSMFSEFICFNSTWQNGERKKQLFNKLICISFRNCEKGKEKLEKL